MARLLRIAATLLAAAALASCSNATMTRLAYANAALAYNKLGSAIAWSVDDYVDMNEAQEAWVKERAARLMDWHRKEELPRARKHLEALLAKADKPFTAEDLASLQGEVRGFYLRAMGRLVPDMAEFLAGADEEQLAHIEKKLSHDNREFLKESVRGTPEERRKRRVHRFVNHLEAWIGPIDDAQRAIVVAAFRDDPDFTEEMMAERRYRQSEVLALVRAKTPKDELEPKLRRLFVNMDEWRRAEYRDQVRARDAKLQAALAEISATLTAKQRAALKDRVSGLIADVDKLTTAS